MRHVNTTLIGLAVLLGAPLVHAQTVTSASASLTDIKFELIDLDQNDGITPSMTWIAGNSWSQLTQQGLQAFPGQTSPPKIAVTEFSDGHLSKRYGSSNIVSAPFGQTSTAANAIRASVSLPYDKAIHDESSMGGSFTLSANTAIKFSGLSTVTVSGRPPDGSYTPNVWNDDAVYKSGALTSIEFGSAPATNRVVSHVSSIVITSPDAKTLTEPLSATFTNATGSSQSVVVSMMAGASSQTNVTFMPELAAWAQMLLGLAGVGMIGLRRQKRS